MRTVSDLLSLAERQLRQEAQQPDAADADWIERFATDLDLLRVGQRPVIASEVEIGRLRRVAARLRRNLASDDVPKWCRAAAEEIVNIEPEIHDYNDSAVAEFAAIIARHAKEATR